MKKSMAFSLVPLTNKSVNSCLTVQIGTNAIKLKSRKKSKLIYKKLTLLRSNSMAYKLHLIKQKIHNKEQKKKNLF